MTDRLLRPAELPLSLWDPQQSVLRLPPRLAQAYRDVLARRGLEERARLRNQSPVGGLSKAQAEDHFAFSFDGSVARAELAMLDPAGDAIHVSDNLVRLFAGGRIALLDIPSGAGALSLGLLCAVAELRACGKLPREKLDAAIVCGEISAHARSIAADLMAELVPELEAQAIFAEFQQTHWDACDKLSTTDLVKSFTVASASSTKKQVAVSNFTAALSQAGKLKQAKHQLEEIFRYASGANSGAVWLEPNINSATASGGVLQAVVLFVKEKLSSYATFVRPPESLEEDDVIATSEAAFESAVPSRGRATVRLAVLRLTLDREGS